MPGKTSCPTCGDYNYPTDPVCLSCGSDLGAPASEPAARAGDSSPAEWDISTPDPARSERLARARELALQVDLLVEQGYHKLPREPDARYGPADDVSDLCREIGECHMRNEDYGQAANWLGRALVISPGNVFARAYLVGSLCRLGRYDEAGAWYEETPGDPIDRNVVRSWLELPAGAAPPRTPHEPHRSRCAAATERLLPSGRRALSLLPEPRSA